MKTMILLIATLLIAFISDLLQVQHLDKIMVGCIIVVLGVVIKKFGDII